LIVATAGRITDPQIFAVLLGIAGILYLPGAYIFGLTYDEKLKAADLLKRARGRF